MLATVLRGPAPYSTPHLHLAHCWLHYGGAPESICSRSHAKYFRTHCHHSNFLVSKVPMVFSTHSNQVGHSHSTQAPAPG